jgi:hypothetical protein
MLAMMTAQELAEAFDAAMLEIALLKTDNEQLRLKLANYENSPFANHFYYPHMRKMRDCTRLGTCEKYGIEPCDCYH